MLQVFIHQIILFRTTKKFDILSVDTLTDIVILILFAYAPHQDEDVMLLIKSDVLFPITSIIGIFSLHLGMSLFLGKEQRINTKLPRIEMLRETMFVGICVIFISSIVIIVFHKVDECNCSLTQYFFGERLYAYKESLEEGTTSAFFYSIATMTRPVLLLLLYYYINSKKFFRGSLIFIILMLGILAIFATRLEILITLALPVAYYHYKHRKLSIFSLSLLFILFLIIMTALNVWRGGGWNKVGSSILDYQYIIGNFGRDLSPLKGYSILWQYDKAGLLDYEYGLAYIYSMLTFIPRYIWNSKPLTAFEPRMTYQIIGSFIQGGVWTFTAWGEGLVQFGIIGIPLNMFLYGATIAIARKISSGIEGSILASFYYSVLAATYLRGSFSSLLFLTIVYFGFLKLFLYLSTTTKPKFKISTQGQY